MSVQSSINSVISNTDRAVGVLKFFQGQEIEGAIKQQDARISELSKNRNIAASNSYKASNVPNRDEKTGRFTASYRTIFGYAQDAYQKAIDAYERQRDVIVNMPQTSLIGRHNVLTNVKKANIETDKTLAGDLKTVRAKLGGN